MYGGFITPPDDDGAHFGVLFWHKDGFSTACGHGTIALGVWAVQTGRIELSASGTADVVIDVPSGRVVARVRSAGQRVTAVDFINVPSYVTAADAEVPTSHGTIPATLASGGAFYAIVDAASLGLRVTPEHLPQLIAQGRQVRRLLNDSPHIPLHAAGGNRLTALPPRSVTSRSSVICGWMVIGSPCYRPRSPISLAAG
jgi:proline racemase